MIGVIRKVLRVKVRVKSRICKLSVALSNDISVKYQGRSDATSG